VCLCQVLGTDALHAYLDKYDIQLDRHYDGILGRHSQKSWHTCVLRPATTQHTQHLPEGGGSARAPRARVTRERGRQVRDA